MNTNYQPGDTVNGHVLTTDGQWVPAAQPNNSVALASHVEAETDRRMANAKTTAWLLWVFLGGFNAHLAYIYPKQRWVIVIISVVAFILTFGISGFLWLGTWAFLLSNNSFAQLREARRVEVEREIATRKALYA